MADVNSLRKQADQRYHESVSLRNQSDHKLQECLKFRQQAAAEDARLAAETKKEAEAQRRSGISISAFSLI